MAVSIVVGAGALPLSAQTPAPAPAVAPRPDDDTRPYDDRLSRLAEILGAVHFLRELCGANEGQQWRERMRELIEAEGASALRRARLSRSFNSGYRLFARTYQACSPSAQSAAQKYMTEGMQIAEGLVKSVP